MCISRIGKASRWDQARPCVAQIQLLLIQTALLEPVYCTFKKHMPRSGMIACTFPCDNANSQGVVATKPGDRLHPRFRIFLGRFMLVIGDYALASVQNENERALR